MYWTDEIRRDLELVEQIPLYLIDDEESFTLDQHLAFNRIVEFMKTFVADWEKDEKDLNRIVTRLRSA